MTLGVSRSADDPARAVLAQTVATRDEPRRWYFFDAQGQILGRLATQIALVLRGKDRPTFRPHEDRGAVVVVINTDGVRVSGNKSRTKRYRWHTWHPRGFKEFTFAEMMARDSRVVMREAVYGMLPKNRLRNRMITRLKLYHGAAHPHGSAAFTSFLPRP